MRTKPPALHLRSLRHFSTNPIPLAKNRIYPSRIRQTSELDTLTLMSASSRTPLLTLWTTTWCSNCKQVLPLLRTLIEDEKVGEKEGGVGFVEVEMDSPDMGGLGGDAMTRYGIRSIPTLLAFDRQEAQVETRVERLEDLKSAEFLRGWIEREARRHGEGGGGGSLFGWLGKLGG